MRFQIEQYERNRDIGMSELKAGNSGGAKYHLLLAARFLLEAAQDSPPEVKNARHENARKLKTLALSLESERPKAAHADAGDQGGTAASDWLVTEKPNVRFQDIAGLDDVQEAITLRVIAPFRHPEIAERYQKRSGGGILLYGPPGTGKTMIARAVATELDAHFFNVKSSNVMSQWVGVAEKNLAALFESAHQHPVSVIFLDETEALISRRGGNSTVMNRVVPEFLSQVDGLDRAKTCVLLMGATNRPWDLDEAALRTGRFGEKFFVGLPETAARLKILEASLSLVPRTSDVELTAWAERLQGYSGADLSGFCLRATDFPFQRQLQTGREQFLESEDLCRAEREVKPTVTKAMLEKYRRFQSGEYS